MRARTLSRIVIAKAVVALTLTAGAGGVALATTSTSLPAEDTETVASTTLELKNAFMLLGAASFFFPGMK